MRLFHEILIKNLISPCDISPESVLLYSRDTDRLQATALLKTAAWSLIIWLSRVPRPNKELNRFIDLDEAFLTKFYVTFWLIL